MTIETTHNGKRITYGENSDDWSCGEYDLTAKTLSALKAKINDFDAKERKLGKNGVTLLKVGGYRIMSNKEIFQRVRATLLDKDIEPGSNHACVWITHLDGQREKVILHSLIIDTPENIATLTEADRLKKEGAATIKRAEKMEADIKRLTVEEIKAMALDVKP